jgi:hypothetical protein
MDIKNIINEITTKTFEGLKNVYANQKEGHEFTQGDNGSRLIFPHYSTVYRDGETRISEQELRFVFIEQFNAYCVENNLMLFYSVETPTEYKYTFTDKNNPHKDEDGQSAMFDLCIHNEKLERIALVEFKALNPDEFCYNKDFCKLDAEKECKPELETFFIMMVKKTNTGTYGNIRKKIENKGENTVFRCYDLEAGEDITSKIEES